MFLTFGRKLSNSHNKYIMILTFKKEGLNSIHVAVKIHYFYTGKQYQTKNTGSVSVADIESHHYERRNIGVCFLRNLSEEEIGFTHTKLINQKH